MSRTARRKASTLGFAEHITTSKTAYHACDSKHITRDVVALYHDGIAVHITLGFAEHITPSKTAYHACDSKHITKANGFPY